MTGLWLKVRRSGWFVRSATGGIFPFPFAWQAWAISLGFVVTLLATGFLHGEAGWIGRITLCVGYIALGMATYE